MVDTVTARYGLVKPEPGSSGWDAKLNANMDVIDAMVTGVLHGHIQNTLFGSGVTQYADFLVPFGTNSTEESDMQRSIVPMTGTLRNLRVKAHTNTITGNPVGLTVYVNGVASGMTASIPAGSTNLIVGAGSVAVSQGDYLTIGIDLSAATGGQINNALSWGCTIDG